MNKDSPPIEDAPNYYGCTVAATSTALLTDKYELTMLTAALHDGTAHRRTTFEVFARRLPEGRRYGVAGPSQNLGPSVRREDRHDPARYPAEIPPPQ